jgi:hypothetical protein
LRKTQIFGRTGLIITIQSKAKWEFRVTA